MSSSSSSSSSGGISFWGLLQVLFIGLKLTGYIAWPWWQVLLPALIGVGLLVALLAICASLAVIEALSGK